MMKEQQYVQYQAWREQMLLLGDTINEMINDDDGTFVAWSASDPEARNDFNEVLWHHNLDHVSEKEMQTFEEEYDSHL